MSNYEYDAVVIGGGAAGLTASGFAANLGAKTMMIEAGKLGGDCTWTGCVPSKILLKAAKVARQMRQAGKYGLTDTEPEINFQKLMRHVHSTRQQIYEEADAPPNFEKMGVDVVKGKAIYRNSHTLEIQSTDGKSRSVTAAKFFICAGASPAVPPIEGIESVDYVTTESLFEMGELPGELIIIGAGPVGTEMAQAMNSLGATVKVIDQAGRILSNDNAELAEMMQDHLQEEGINYFLNATINNIDERNGKKMVHLRIGGESKTVSGDVLLLATGRKPNVKGLNLGAAGIQFNREGLKVDKNCRTNISHIYACGDITGEYFFTHMSDHMAKVAVSNALLKIPMKIDRAHVPWCTYTDPELAHVGATQQQVVKNGKSFEVYRFPYSRLDRAIVASEETGLVKVFATKWKGKILGASILGARAGELISEFAVAMKNGVSLASLSGTIHPYPSYGMAARRAADEWMLEKRPAWLIKTAKTILGYRGEVPDSDDADDIA